MCRKMCRRVFKRNVQKIVQKKDNHEGRMSQNKKKPNHHHHHHHHPLPCVSCNAWLELLMTTILGLKTTIRVRKNGEGAEDKCTPMEYSPNVMLPEEDIGVRLPARDARDGVVEVVGVLDEENEEDNEEKKEDFLEVAIVVLLLCSNCAMSWVRLCKANVLENATALVSRHAALMLILPKTLKSNTSDHSDIALPSPTDRKTWSLPEYNAGAAMAAFLSLPPPSPPSPPSSPSSPFPPSMQEGPRTFPA